MRKSKRSTRRTATWIPRRWTDVCKDLNARVRGIFPVLAEAYYILRTLPDTTSAETKRSFLSEFKEATEGTQSVYRSYCMNLSIPKLVEAAQGKLGPSEARELAKGRSTRAWKKGTKKHTRATSPWMRVAKQLANLSPKQAERAYSKSKQLRNQ